MTRKNIFSLAAMLVVLVTAASAQTRTGIQDSERFLGSIVDNVYKNEFFGFEISAPPEMYVLSKTEKEQSREAGAEFLSKDASGNRDAFVKATTAEVVIFSIADRAPGEGTASLNVGALKQPAGVTPRMVCDSARHFLVRNPRITVGSDTSAATLAGKQAARVEFKVRTDSVAPLHVRYYAAIVRGYSVTFVITYMEQSQLQKFEKLLSTLKFSQK
jgi:hypothetical protein